MSRTILYYNIFVSKNGHLTDIKMNKLIDKIWLNHSIEENRLYQSSLKYAMLHLHPVRDERTSRALDRGLAIGKYRDTYKPYTGRKNIGDANPIDDDVIEITSAYFYPQYYMVAIEYSHYGCRPNGIAKYLSKFLPKQDTNEDKWDIVLKPIETPANIDDIRYSTKIHSIEFSIDTLQGVNGNHFPELNDDPEDQAEENEDSYFKDLLSTAAQSNNYFGANTAKVTFTNGGKRNRIIQSEELIDLIEQLNFEDELFESVKVEYDSPVHGKRHKVDLKNEGIKKDVITQDDDSTGYEFILDEIDYNFHDINHKPGSRNHEQYIRSLIAAELPEQLVLPNVLTNDEPTDEVVDPNNN